MLIADILGLQIGWLQLRLERRRAPKRQRELCALMLEALQARYAVVCKAAEAGAQPAPPNAEAPAG